MKINFRTGLQEFEMAKLFASGAGSLDVFETAIASLLTATIEKSDPNSFSIAFSEFSDDVTGYGLKYDDDGFPIEGYITEVKEFYNGTLLFSLTEILVSAADLNSWLNDGNYMSFFPSALSGDDTVTGSVLNDRIYAFSGNDTIKGGAGDDEIDGGAGSDLLDGGRGDDIIYGGSEFDTAHFSGLFRSYSVSQKDGVFVVSGPDGIDTLDGVEKILFDDGSVVIDPDLASQTAAAQIIRLYDTVLQRQPDAVGLDFYVDHIEDLGASIAAVASDLLNSGEFQAATGSLSNGAFVEYIYQHALDREADPDGKAYYTNLLDNGGSRADLLISFSESAEHRSLTNDAMAQAFFNTDDSYQAVALLFNSFAGRKPDAGGLIYYAEQLKAGRLTLAQAADDFATSNEFKQATSGLSNGQLVDYMYRNTLEREADAGGRAYYTNALDRGLSKGALLLEFSQSQEHYNYLAESIIGGIETL
jgi:hypothetical protein